MKRIFKYNKITSIILVLLFAWVILNVIRLNNDSQLREYDAITVFFYILANSNLSILQIISPMLVIIPTIYFFHKELHSGSIKNFLMRQNYSCYMKRILLFSIKKIWILPLMMIVLFLGSIVISNGFDFTKAVPKILGYSKDGIPIMIGTISPINPSFYNVPLQLMIVFLTTILLHSILYANIGLITSKKNKNIIVSIISAFLVYIGLNIISELILGKFFLQVLNFRELNGVFNLFGIWIYCDYINLIGVLVYSIILVIISYIFLYFTYKNKEEVIINCEK